MSISPMYIPVILCLIGIVWMLKGRDNAMGAMGFTALGTIFWTGTSHGHIFTEALFHIANSV